MAPRPPVPSLEDVLLRLTSEHLSLLESVGARSRPELAAVSWIRGRPPRQADLMVGWRSRFVRNLAHQKDIALAVFFESVFTLSGTAEVVEKLVPGLPVPLARVRLTFDGVYDGLFTGGRLAGPPLYEKVYPPKLANLDRLVEERLDGEPVPTVLAANTSRQRP